MSESDKQAAKEHATRAATQLKHATSNLGDAVEHVAEHTKDETLEKAADAAEAVSKVDFKRFARHLDKASTGFVILAGSLFVASMASKKFRAAFLAPADEVVNGEVVN